MPVVVISPSKAKAGKVCKYIMQEKKTRDELKFGCGCTPDIFDKDFELLDKCYMKKESTDRRKYYHIKLSWAREDCVNPKDARDMAIKFCEQSNIKGCQYAGSIHVDTGTVHAHIVVNNVRFEDNEYGKAGQCYQATKKSREKMMQVANELAKEYGLLRSIIPEKGKAKERYTRGEVELYKKGELPWKDKLRWEIDEAKRRAGNSRQWKKLLKNEYGVDVEENKKGQYRYYPNGKKDGERGCPGKRLGSDYEKENIEKYFRERELLYDRERGEFYEQRKG